MVFQEDNDGSHGTRSCDNIAAHYKSKLKVDYIDDWPPNSPETNPIENVWRILKSRVKLHHSMSHQQLRRAIEKEWNAITFDEINKCIFASERGPDRGEGGAKGKNCQMRNRVRQVIDRNGLSTKF